MNFETTGPMWLFLNGQFIQFFMGGIGANSYITLPVNCGSNLIEVFVLDFGNNRPGIRF